MQSSTIMGFFPEFQLKLEQPDQILPFSSHNKKWLLFRKKKKKENECIFSLLEIFTSNNCWSMAALLKWSFRATLGDTW